MVEIKTFDRGESARISNEYTDVDGAAFDPTISVELRIYKPDGSLDTTVAYPGDIVKDAVGEYHYDYAVDSAADVGWWISKWTGVSTGFSDVSRGQFKVVDPELKLYCTVEKAYNICGMESTVADRDEVIDYIKNAMSHIDSMYQKNFGYSNDVEEWFDTDQPDINTVVNALFLTHTPVRAVTSVKEYDTSGDEVADYEAADYRVDLKTGRIKLKSKSFGHDEDRVCAIYTYGHDTVPDKISMLCAVMTGQSILLKFAGASYDDITSYNACNLSVSIGEPYMNATRTYELLNKEKDKLIADIGRLRPSVFIV